jgi:arginase family enzyme
MKDISLYFHPVQLNDSVNDASSLGGEINYNMGSFPALSKGDVVLIYVPEFRGFLAQNLNQRTKRDHFRKFLGDLYPGNNWTKRIFDLGDILPGETVQDTYFALSNVLEELIKIEVFPILIGGTQDLCNAQYRSYAQLEQTVNMVSVDAKFDLGEENMPLSSEGYLMSILMQEPCFLFNYSNIGYQSYFAKREELQLFEKLYFDTCRLGAFNQNFKFAEPLLRNADMLSFDLTSIRNSDFSSSFHNSPNGFYAEQACQIARYAGVSDKLSSFGLYNLFPEINKENEDHLVAQIIWHLIDGLNSRQGDFPIGSKSNYTKYSVSLLEFKDEIVFYKSDRTDRWWMEVPFPAGKEKKFERHHLVPCNYEDYQKAMQNEVPDLWWKTYQKLC